MYLLILAIGLTATILFYLFFIFLNRNSLRVKRRMQQIKKGIHEHDVAYEANKSQDKKWFHHFSVFTSWQKRLRKELKLANLRMKTNEFLIILLISWILAFLCGYLLSGSLLRSSMLGFIGLMLPFVWVILRKKNRKKKLENQLGDMLSITSNSLKAGYSILQSLELLSRELSDPLAEEIQRLVHEMQLGVSMEEALQNLNERVQSKDLDLIITAILIQRQVGGNLAQILDNISNTIRERVKIKGEIQALTAQGRLSGLIFMILPVALACFLYMINPEYILLLFTEPIGWLFVTLAVVGQVVGAIFIRKIVNIDV